MYRSGWLERSIILTTAYYHLDNQIFHLPRDSLNVLYRVHTSFNQFFLKISSVRTPRAHEHVSYEQDGVDR